ncbi:ATP-binding cassette domain-containing protein [Staphylococcus ureilyticus]|uniref:ATP-binding cassette domain-containing protein n=1 Tax=Staphylococcus TaxID=1279 RepID=UPI0008A2FE05|nr:MULTISPECIES: excinuclease ABC subunit UvrA [Staphylococcus]MDK7752330.1 excinuclease ABC subunit UvrA [Staphylococcus sp. UMB10092B]MDT3982579.1 excinuclease ABC subunit UvrA [Staphylococcus ureilyticus]OFQ89510.1 daunorubicin resistance protein DrrC [Staphylococcus sp. HMSC065A08]OHO41468.1 daunorubicin resistance protein DrrC [Staphylococcus sp. HMSC034G07]OLF33669.1 daunorubicin resistance protein DrrC [Staphylococcus sp. 47.1]
MSIIRIHGAKQNNLKDISVDIPKHKISVFTGRSGSGKSSLVFNTIAAESERLLNETYSTYIQNQLKQYSKPNVDLIEHLPVAMIINQKRLGGNSRSTVGTISDIYASVRLLWSRIGTPFVGYSDIFSFNNPKGMCETCSGLGYIEDINLEELLDFEKSLNEDAIRFPSFRPDSWRGKRYLYSGLFDNDKKLKHYTKEELDTLLYTKPTKLKNPPENWPKTAKFEGLIHRFRRSFLLNDNFEKNKFKNDIERVVTSQKCPTCDGKRLNQNVLKSKINGLDIADFTHLSIDDAMHFIKKLESSKAQFIINPLLKQLESLSYIGLNYLTLDRETKTLSGGESQRIKLIRHLNSPLSDLVYIIDEPSVGLHPEDIQKINEIIQSLKNKGNTVLVVEHDPDVIKIADHIIDLGPYAGKNGGEIIFTGSYSSLLSSNSSTGQALKKKHKLKSKVRPTHAFINLNHMTQNNLKDISARIPKHAMTVVTGVAGSGKSTLIHGGLKNNTDAIIIDQKPVHASSRSHLLTYLDIFEDVRNYFSNHTGLKKSLFSYNSEGACPECHGKGVLKTELAFMPDFTQICNVCGGKRYKPEVLSATIAGYSIADILNLTVDEALDFFHTNRSIAEPLQSLKATGLNYMSLGQTLDTLSGGEIQRVKLSKYLTHTVSGHIFVFDEPTTGLHEDDIPIILASFDNLIEQGNTVIIIEHNLTMMTHADWIIDIGPYAGNKGGKLLYQGKPDGLLTNTASVTAKHLNSYLS